MFETIVGALVIAVIVGYTHLAYNHPREFRYTTPVILAIGTLVMVATFSFNLGTSAASIALLPFIEVDRFTAAMDAVEEKKFSGWIAIGLLPALLVYLMILWGVSYLKKDKN